MIFKNILRDVFNEEEEEEERIGGNFFSFELGFQINNLIELGFLKIFYMMYLTNKKKKRGSIEICFLLN
jgi:hypothetical protein